jgi:hypothetical protein
MIASSSNEDAGRRGLILVFAAAFSCAGCVALIWLGPLLPRITPLPAATAAPTATATATVAPVSSSVLLLFVDEAGALPELQGAWVIRWLPDARDTYIFAAPYDLWVDLDGSPGRLNDAFARAGRDGALPLIRNSVGRDVARETLADVIVIDRPCLDELALRLGGLNVNGLAAGSSPWDAVQRSADSVETLGRQQELIKALVDRLRTSEPNEIALAWYGLLTQTNHANLPYARFAEFVNMLATDSRHQEIFYAPVNVYEPFVAPDGLPATRRTAAQP